MARISQKWVEATDLDIPLTWNDFDRRCQFDWIERFISHSLHPEELRGNISETEIRESSNTMVRISQIFPSYFHCKKKTQNEKFGIIPHEILKDFELP